MTKELKRKEMKESREINKAAILVVTLMIVLGTCMHFVCDLVNNDDVMKILGVIFPVNETSWEHMKMLWYPFLAGGIVLSKKQRNAGIFGGFVIGGTVAMLTIIGCFTLYQSFTISSVLILDIILFTLDIILCAMLGFLLAKQDWCRKSLIVWIVLAVIITAGIIYLTYCPGSGYIFLDNEGLAAD